MKVRKRRNDITTFESIYKEIQENGSELVSTLDYYEEQVSIKKQSPTAIKLEIFCCQCKEEKFPTNLRRLRERGKYHCKKCAMKNRSMTYHEVKNYIENESVSY